MSRPLIHTSMVRISDLEAAPFEVEERASEEWTGGEYVVAEVTSRDNAWQAELTTGRLVRLDQGDLLVGALGRRHATLDAVGSWEAVRPDGLMHLLTGGGLLGRVTSRSTLIPPLPELRYVGHVVREGAKVGMRAFRTAGDPARPFSIPTILVIGTSMSAGKTASARVVIRRLSGMGLRVIGAKLTGAGRYRDVLSMRDAGAQPIYDFVDAGLPSTVCPTEEYEEAIGGLLSRMDRAEVDAAVIEVGASPLEPYNGTTAVEKLAGAVRMTMLCASDPYAVVGIMTAYGTEPHLVTGIASNTRAGVELVQRLVKVPCLDVLDPESLPDLDALLRRHLGLDGEGSP